MISAGLVYGGLTTDYPMTLQNSEYSTRNPPSDRAVSPSIHYEKYVDGFCYCTLTLTSNLYRFGAGLARLRD